MAEQKDPNYGQLSTASTAQQAIENTPPKQVDGKPRSVDTQVVAGNAISGPKNTSGMNNKQAMIATLNSAASGLYKEDKHQYNKLTTFNSSHTGHNFDRYYAHPSFKQLGFSPFRDNESFYNQNSSLWDDAVRGGITAGKLAWLGGASTFKNWGSMFSSEGNTEDSDEMERLMSIGMSNREGFGAKVVNFGVNMGYTYGVVGEILAEEAALALGTYLTGGGLGGVAALRTGMNVGRIAKAFEGFKAISTISKARELWNSSKALQGVGKLASHLAPLENTRALFTTAGKATAKWGELTDMAKVSKSFGAFYRDLREINAVTSEARLEGGGIQSGVTNQLIADFKKDKGRDPNDQEAEAIFRQAHQAGVTGSLMNSAGIYLSNKVVLDRALKGIPGMEALGQGATRKIRGSFLLNKAWKAAGKDPYELVKGVKQLGKAAFYKQTFNPKNLVKGGLGYMSANLMEGAQEVYQEAVANGLTDYYVSTYNDPSRAGSAEFRTKLLHGLKSQASEQGVETFLSGFLMAGPMSGMQSAFYGAVDMVKAKKLKKDAAAFAENPENAGKENPYQRELDKQTDFENKTLESMNETTKNAPTYFSALERDIKIQNDLARSADQAAADGDVKGVKDARDASLVNHTITLLQAGKFNIFEEQLKSLGELSGPELQEAFGEDPTGTGKTVAERLKNVLARTKEIKSSFEEYQGMINPHSMEKNPMPYLAFEHAREVMIHDDIRYKRTGQRMSDLYTEFSSNLPFSKANGADFANLFSIGDPDSPSLVGSAGMRSEIKLLDQEIAIAEAGDDAAKIRATGLKKKRDSLSSLANLVQIHKAQYIVNQSVNHTEESFAENERALADLEIQLKDSFVNHIKVLAEENGQNVLTKDLDRAYQQFSDYWKLNADQGQVANALNILHDPYMFNQSTQRLEAAMRTAMAQREEKLKGALKEFLARRHKNKFFNDLFDNFNVFIDPEEADAYINENEVPTTFFDADSMEEIQPGSEKYKGIMALIDEYDDAYFEKEGKRMMRTGTGGLMSFRGKEDTDKRTIKQLGEEYGFDHTDVLSYVNIEKVLKAVMSSKFASKDMKKLAQALLSIVDKNTQITFKTNHFTNSTYDDVNGVIVDPKFSAEGFTTGIVPMEFSILNGIMQQVMDKSLEDTDFNDRMTVLREKFIENLNDDQKKEFQLAMKDNAGFVAEVMTNPYIQGVLDAIPLEGEATAQTAEAKTLWQSFLDEVKALLEKLFGSKRSASLYDEAVTVITNKLSQPGVVAADPIAEETFDEPTEDADLEKLLKQGFDAALAPLNAEERAGMNYQAWKETSPEARDITNKYKADKIKRGTAPKPEGPTPLTESERKKQMTALGYTIAEMNSLTADQVNQIIAEKKKKRIYVDTLKGEMNFDEFPPMLDYIDDVIDEMDLKLQSANLALSADQKVYIQFDALGRPIAGTEHERVSNVVKTKDGEIGKESSDRGTIIDSLLRDFLNRSITDIEKFKTKYEEYRAKNPSAGAFSEKMLEDLFDKFRSVELFIKQKGLKIRANIPALYGTIGETRTAGSIDLLAYDAAGRVFIIDLKTSTQDRRMQYKLEEMLEAAFGAEWPGVREVIRASKGDLYKAENRVSAEQKAKLKAIYSDPQFSSNIKTYKDKEYFPIYFYKSEDARQQNAYMELLRQTTGIKAYGTFIFPLILSKTNNIYTSVEFQKEDGNHTMTVKRYDIHKEMGLENQVTAYPEDPLSKEKLDEFRETPEEEPTPTPTPTPQPTGEMDIVNTPSQDIIDELNKLGSVNEKLEWLKNNNLIAPITIGGKSYNVIDYSDRVMVLMKIGKYNIPFYISTGQAGKKNVKAGNWYIVFGIGREGWINKGSEEEINKQYDNPAFQKFARILNESIGRIVSREDNGNGKIKDGIGFLADDATSIAEFNAQMNLPTEPASNHMSSYVFYNHVNSTLGLVNDEIKALKKEPVSEPPVDRAAEIKRKIEALEDKIKTLYRFKSDTDSNAAVVQAEKDIAKYEEQLKKLQEELAALEEQPTKKTTDQIITDLKAREQVELRKAIPNIDDYPDTYGEKQGNMPGVLYGIYKVIYDKYDKLITDASGAKPKSGTGTQTKMDFDELTLNVGDRVKVNTPKDGEGIIKEDRGDKVLLEDGRQVMKKSLTKLEPVDNEPVTIESSVPDTLKGKVIFVTPTKESTTMLTGIPGVTYGSTIYLDRVLEGFDDTLIENLRNGISKLSEDTDDAKKVKTAGIELLDILDRYKSPAKDVTTDDVKTINGALVRLTNQTAESYIPASIITKIKKIQSNAWTKTMSDARSLANEGQTVVFDLNGAAASGKIDLALISATSDLGDLGYNYDKALANIKGKSYNITGKNILDILNGTVDLDYTIPEIIREKLLSNINDASKKELGLVEILLPRLPKAVLDQVLADQNLTMEQVDKAIATRKNKLATIFDMDDLVVDKANPTVVQYTINEITGKQEFGGQGRKQGVVISNDGLRVRLAEFVPGLSFEDLEESENVVTFTAKEVPYFILPLKPQTPTTVDPDVNSQSDAMMNDPVSDPGTSMSNLKNDLDSAKNVSAADALASFKKNQKCNKKGK